MKALFQHKHYVLLSRFILGVILIWASVYKIEDPVAFAKIVHNYHVFPVFLENLIALIVPWLELILGVCLLFGVFLDGVSYLSIAIFILFIVILSQAYLRGIDLHCGCFSSDVSGKVNDLRADMLKRILEDIVYLGCAIIIKYRSWFLRDV
jgi:uncharacterized membrane protein YphA (DoxX/SURF4 family)